MKAIFIGKTTKVVFCSGIESDKKSWLAIYTYLFSCTSTSHALCPLA
jgi:hypothetical protein